MKKKKKGGNGLRWDGVGDLDIKEVGKTMRMVLGELVPINCILSSGMLWGGAVAADGGLESGGRGGEEKNEGCVVG